MALVRWPPAWVETWPLGDEGTIGVAEGVELVTAERADGQVLMSLTWPEGRRWLRVDPSGAEPPEALRAGEPAADHARAREIDALWSQALRVAKLLIDGDPEELARLVHEAQQAQSGEEEGKRRFWRRG